MVLPRSTKRALALASLFALPLACSVGSGDSHDGLVPEVAVGQDQPIITGSKDTGHPAVVLLQMTLPPDPGSTRPNFALCTGTIISTNPTTKVGYVLTAGHCVRNATTIQVLSGNDFSSATGIASYAFLDAKAHPQYDGQTSSPYDVAMVRILGVDATTPVVPVLSPDQMSQNQTRVTSVGFGQTTRPNSHVDAGMNTAKNRISGTVTRLTSQQMGVTYDNHGDICHGDSGGPVLTVVNGQEYVAGVHSFVTGDCVGQGYSVRASAQIAFYRSIINAPAPAETCELCRKKSLSGTQTCAVARGKCLDDEQCGGLAKCLGRCSSTTGGDAGASADCQKACVAQFPYGVGPYQSQIAFCSCNECDSACSGDTQCAAAPRCGMKFADATCNGCMEGGCCAEESACASDGHCSFCMKNPGAAECASNAMLDAVRSCRATKCATECPTN
ncbi:MAG: S1 family peptidase [Labilithrix sp.]